MGHILMQIGQELVAAFDQLERQKNLSQHWIKIHALENEGDVITRRAMGDLFTHESDAIELIKWKDVYALLEKAVDRAEDIANVLEGVMIKNG